MKTGIDTNVVIRWLVEEPGAEEQADQATRIMSQDDLHLSSIALAEAIWALNRTYRFSRTQIARVVEALLGMGNLEIESRDIVKPALAEFESHGGDFNDHLIAAYDRRAGCGHTLTFDKKAVRSKQFKLI
jgi:predicted nucleic-acid-binding protein